MAERRAEAKKKMDGNGVCTSKNQTMPANSEPPGPCLGEEPVSSLDPLLSGP